MLGAENWRQPDLDLSPWSAGQHWASKVPSLNLIKITVVHMSWGSHMMCSGSGPMHVQYMLMTLLLLTFPFLGGNKIMEKVLC